RSGSTAAMRGWRGSGRRQSSTTADRSVDRANRWCSRQRVPATGVERVAAGDPGERHAPAAPPAVTLDGLVAVLRAGRRVAATGYRPENWAERQPVDPDEGKRDRR